MPDRRLSHTLRGLRHGSHALACEPHTSAPGRHWLLILVMLCACGESRSSGSPGSVSQAGDRSAAIPRPDSGAVVMPQGGSSGGSDAARPADSAPPGPLPRPDTAVAMEDAGTETANDAATGAATSDDERDIRWDAPYSGKYTDDTKWLCRPGLPNNPCAAALSVTELHADGTTTVSALPQASEDVGVDCFYVYPTVDVGLFAPPRNRDFSEIELEPVLDVMAGQAQPFRGLCNMYAPVYRQASLVSFMGDEATRERALETGYQDAADAFEYYLRDADPGRPLVLLAHSQGSMVTLRLIVRHIQDDARLRKRLVVAALVGPLGGFEVPKGKLVGGTLEDLPLCSSEQQTGCVLTYNAFLKENPPNSEYTKITGGVAAGYDTGCTNPAADGEALTRLKGALFVARYRQTGLSIPLDWGGARVDTDYARYDGLYTGQCKVSATGLSYLEIAVAPLAGDVRKNPVPFDNLALADPSLGLHSLDYAFVAGELYSAVERKIAAYAQASP